MANIFSSSIGKKLIMSVSGLFLIMFLLVHLTVNLMILFDSTGELFNEAAHFMTTNPIIKIMEPLLALGFLIHIFYGTYLEYRNNKARPVKYAVSNKSDASWSSKNMLLTGIVIFAFLTVHLWNYFYKIKFTDLISSGSMTESDLVRSIFMPERWYFSIFYIVSFILLALHLNHSFQSAFQTLGLNNNKWLNRWKVIGMLYAFVIAAGFSVIPIAIFIQEYFK
ncbi:MAG: succinate dehydrogenase [Bacteroidetes bacterium HGW-Bacteroidetes-21]|jgi:succinate dehydrogenase / fumarate reductase cytochrome b subunit|nr:MAG: succinate dehydrogenase [Bacteroidetes bacterium HGW-Bacteroidetes-21]